MSSIVVLRQDDHGADSTPTLWDLDPALLEMLRSIAERAARCGEGARLVVGRPGVRPQVLASARWRAGNWASVASTVLECDEPVVEGLVFASPIRGPRGLRGVLLFLATSAASGSDLASAFASHVEAELAHAEARVTSGGSITQTLFTMVSAHDSETGRHSLAVQRLAVALGRALGLAPLEMLVLERASLLHDVGKVALPHEVLQKTGALAPAEWALMREHPSHGELIVRGVAELAVCSGAIRHHHERWNGTGYPDKLIGATIPLEARIISIVDAFETMRAGRAYRAARCREEALQELQDCAGFQFDPTLVQAFCAIPYHMLGL